jgi:hypothetical protein
VYKTLLDLPGWTRVSPAGGMSRCPFGVFPNYSLRGVPVPVFGQPDRPYIAIPSAVHDELFARMAQPLDITAKRHTPPFGRPAIPWPGKVAEMEDWTKREGFGKSPRYLADKLGSSGAFSQAGYSTCSAVGMLETPTSSTCPRLALRPNACAHRLRIDSHPQSFRMPRRRV